MINKIKNSKSLTPFIADKCEENQICVTMDEGIPKTDYMIIKVDEFYNRLSLRATPPSVDCLIVLKCRDNEFIIYLVELKNIKSQEGFKVDNIYNKFKTTIDNFMGSRYKNIFCNDRYKIKRLKLYFVSDPYGGAPKSRRRLGTTKLDVLLSRPPLKFREKKCQIEHNIPNPMIKGC